MRFFNYAVCCSLVISTALTSFLYADDRHNGSSEAQVIEITTSEYIFTPASFELTAGRPVELKIINKGKEMHEFASEILKGLDAEVNVNGTIIGGEIEEIEVPSGSAVTIEFLPQKKGEFAFICEMKNHNNMKGIITVK